MFEFSLYKFRNYQQSPIPKTHHKKNPINKYRQHNNKKSCSCCFKEAKWACKRKREKQVFKKEGKETEKEREGDLYLFEFGILFANLNVDKVYSAKESHISPYPRRLNDECGRPSQEKLKTGLIFLWFTSGFQDLNR